MTESSRIAKGCFASSNRVLHSIKREINFTKCIGNFFSDSVMNWFELFLQYEKGVMPFPGSIVEQPNKVIEIFRIIGKHRSDRMIEESEKQKAKAKRGR